MLGLEILLGMVIGYNFYGKIYFFKEGLKIFRKGRWEEIIVERKLNCNVWFSYLVFSKCLKLVCFKLIFKSFLNVIVFCNIKYFKGYSVY